MVSPPAEELFESLTSGKHVPGGGPAAALVTAAAAALVAMAARESQRSWDDAAAAVAQAESLRRRATRLAQEDAEALVAYLAARRDDAAEQRPESRDFRLGQALSRAADVPLAIVEAACDVALLAVHAAERAEGDVRPDAAAAAMLALGAARAATHLIEINLATAPDDTRVKRAKSLVRSAAFAADEAAHGAAS